MWLRACECLSNRINRTWVFSTLADIKQAHILIVSERFLANGGNTGLSTTGSRFIHKAQKHSEHGFIFIFVFGERIAVGPTPPPPPTHPLFPLTLPEPSRSRCTPAHPDRGRDVVPGMFGSVRSLMETCAGNCYLSQKKGKKSAVERLKHPTARTPSR